MIGKRSTSIFMLFSTESEKKYYIDCYLLLLAYLWMYEKFSKLEMLPTSNRKLKTEVKFESERTNERMNERCFHNHFRIVLLLCFALLSWFLFHFIFIFHLTTLHVLASVCHLLSITKKIASFPFEMQFLIGIQFPELSVSIKDFLMLEAWCWCILVLHISVICNRPNNNNPCNLHIIETFTVISVLSLFIAFLNQCRKYCCLWCYWCIQEWNAIQPEYFFLLVGINQSLMDNYIVLISI